jgi:hypothetical protein
MYRAVLATTSRAAVRRYATNVPGGATLEKREKTLEDRTVRDHEKQLVDDLVKQLEVPLLFLPAPKSS